MPPVNTVGPDTTAAMMWAYGRDKLPGSCVSCLEMSNSPNNNRRFLTRLWIPVLLFSAFVVVVMIAALTSGDAARTTPVIVGLAVAAVAIVVSRWFQKHRVARMLLAPDPSPFLRSIAASARRIPHGSLLAAANAATVLALYGRFREAEEALRSVSWQGAPPLIQAQASAARAVLAYVQGAVNEGLDYAVAATQEAPVDVAFPGAAIAELAFRTYRNLGLALGGRATETTAEELRNAMTRLPVLGQILAAWGLAVIARSMGDVAEVNRLRSFIEQQAPHFTPVLESTAAG